MHPGLKRTRKVVDPLVAGAARVCRRASLSDSARFRGRESSGCHCSAAFCTACFFASAANAFPILLAARISST
eukprot:3982024-Lingulodinium_polyedra.AAC.1